MSDLDYQIVVPSRKRVHNMPLIMELLPTAKITVDEREYDDYAQVVPEHKLLPHPPISGLLNVINWMQDAVENEILIEIDDDFRGVKVMTGSNRFTTDPEEILGILENSARATQDLGLSVFCYARTANPVMLKPDHKPIIPMQPIVSNAFGMMGAARYRRYNGNFLGKADMDWALRTYLEDRCVYADVRFYFDCGRVFAGQGGNVGLVTPEQFKQTTLALKHKWGKHITFKAPSWQKNRSVDAVGLRIKRNNPTAQK